MEKEETKGGAGDGNVEAEEQEEGKSGTPVESGGTNGEGTAVMETDADKGDDGANQEKKDEEVKSSGDADAANDRQADEKVIFHNYNKYFGQNSG